MLWVRFELISFVDSEGLAVLQNCEPIIGYREVQIYI